MNEYAHRALLTAALAFGALGISLLWAGGVEFPIVVPPGLVILTVGAVVVSAVRRRWTAWLGCVLGVFVLVGFVVSGINGEGFENLVGDHGTTIAVGQVVQLIGVGAAAALGATLGLRSPARD
ncbi:hypothetical protein ABIE44_001741 [Marmoricola sp. OAE513]|uniref:hypothetical protein n=1 Tax=Marmoricola sp. OAE513 TaxID=2817894 RepID=UPI001AE6AF73